MSQNIKICLFGAKDKGEDSRSVGLISEAARRMGVEFTNLPKGKLIAKLVDGKLEFYANGFDINEPDAYIFRGVSKMIEPDSHDKVSVSRQMALFANYLHNDLGKVIVDEIYLRPNPTYTKFTDQWNLSKAGIATIPTWMFMKTEELVKSADTLPYPVIMKPADGSGGRDVYKFNSKDELVRHLKDVYKKVIFYPNMIQQCIENDGDYRVVVLGGEIVVALKKHRNEDSVVANMGQGNLAEPVEIDEELKTMAIDAAKALSIEFAGVDIIEDIKTGKRYIMEVNVAPQITLSSKFAQIDIGEELVKYIIKKVEKRRG